ncbi:uncharacterized protein G2W53_029401 [Senna tora]|uniref:Uncharacterized protein n=1 Tax=Senna tora TaxID=362788 RepID=A0A834T7K0_9FABA|nr:uncharacterized protein G2W53_029401 [Senna tora]
MEIMKGGRIGKDGEQEGTLCLCIAFLIYNTVFMN